MKQGLTLLANNLKFELNYVHILILVFKNYLIL